MAPYEECNGCLATSFCKKFSGEVPISYRFVGCNAKFRLYKALELSEIPKLYWGADIFNYKKDADNSGLFEKIKPLIDNIVDEVNSGRNLFFYGKRYGTGKTYHGAMFLNHYIYKSCLTKQFDFEHPLALFVSYPDLMDDVRYRREESRVIDRLEAVKSVPVLLLDDVGSGTMSDFVREQTFLIVNHRYNNRLSTIVTANFDLEELIKPSLLGGRILSRLTSNFYGTKIGGGDRRRSFS